MKRRSYRERVVNQEEEKEVTMRLLKVLAKEKLT